LDVVAIGSWYQYQVSNYAMIGLAQNTRKLRSYEFISMPLGTTQL